METGDAPHLTIATTNEVDVVEVDNNEENSAVVELNAEPNGTSISPEKSEENDVFVEVSPKRSIMSRRKSLLKEPCPGGRKSHGKVVTFGSLPTELTVRSAKDCLKHMYSGGQLVKVRSASRVYRRFYWLDEDSMQLKWEPSKKDSDKARICVDEIHEVRSGKNSEVFLSVDTAEHFPEECAFSIIYGVDYQTLDLVAATTEEANIWCTGLRCLISGTRNSDGNLDTTVPGSGSAKEAREKWLREMFELADVNNDGLMDEEEAISLIKTLSDGVRDNVIKNKLHEYLRSKKTSSSLSEVPVAADGEEEEGLTIEEFIELFKDVATRPEVYFTLVRYASQEDALSIDDLKHFLEIEQGIAEVTREACLDIVNECEPSTQLRHKEMLGIDGFTRYLTSNRCALFNKEKRLPTQNMNFPFSHYFISSSHNTYLIQDQLSGRTSISCFVMALEKGCRCISIDIWSVLENNAKLLTIHHPRNSRQALRLLAQEVLPVINEKAFTASEYPLILVIRVHADVEAQQLLATLLVETFGEAICRANEAPEVQTPESLKLRILLEISGRPADDQFQVAPAAPGLPIITSVIDELQHLNFFTSEIITGVPNGKGPNELAVMPETVASRVATSTSDHLVEAGATQLIRVEPNDSRVDCSNYNPLDVWNMGVQMASLHFQTPGLMMDLNEGMFAANGSCGYALKPGVMTQVPFNHHVEPEISTLHLRIISGTDLPKPRGAGSKGIVIDPYVLIEVFGAASDCAEHRTRTIHNCGRNPVFDETCEFRLTVPDMALIRFVILDDDFIGDEFIGQYTIAYSCLLPGYRVLKLHGIFGEELEGASLLVHIQYSSSREQTKKRTMLRRRPSRSLSKLRTVGVKSADELYKSCAPFVRDATDLRIHHENASHELRESCGLQAQSNIKQVIRHLTMRKIPIKFFMVETGDAILMPTARIDVQTQPEHAKRSCTAIETFIGSCRKLIENGPEHIGMMEEAHEEAIKLSETIQSLGTVDGLKTKKAVKVHENHAWNCRLLRGQIEQLKNAISESIRQLTQVVEGAIQYNLIQGKLPDDWKAQLCSTSSNPERRATSRSKSQMHRNSQNKNFIRNLHRTLSADSSSVRKIIPKTFKRVAKSETDKQ